MRFLTLLLMAFAAQAADVCVPTGLEGAYAFELAGLTTISGTEQPVVALGRFTLDSNGRISGTSSVKIAGFLLGNPVAGTYEAQQDCTVTWQLQDDSGAYQHFAGKYTPDGMKVTFRQTDTGGVRHGIMQKMPDSCNSSSLKPRYSYDVSGSGIPMLPGENAYKISDKRTIDTIREGDFQVDDDCAVHFTLTLASGTLNMRGFLVNGGKEILAFQTDPGAMVAAHLTAVP
jgi:hypothetical protein